MAAIVLISVTVLTASCAGSAEPDGSDPVEGAELYPIDSREEYVSPVYSTIVNRDGDVVMSGSDTSIIYDRNGGGAIGISRQKYGENGEVYSALYDVGGKLIRDFEPCMYEGGRGGLIRAYDTKRAEYGEEFSYERGSRYMLIDAASGELVDGRYIRDTGADDADESGKYESDNYYYYDDDVRIRWPDDDGSSELTDPDGKVLFADAFMLAPFEEEDDGKAKTFVAVRNGVLYALSRDGNVLKERDIGAGDAYALGGGFVFVAGDVFDSDLNVVVKGPCDGATVFPLPEHDFYDAWHYMDGDRVRYIVINHFDYRMNGYDDIFDENGRLIFHDVQPPNGYAYRFGPDRIVLRQGFRQGLADTRGNWIYEESVFQNLSD
jgi:hypothetical protein